MNTEIKNTDLITIKIILNPSTIYNYIVNKTSLVSEIKEKLPLNYMKKISFINNRTKRSIDEKLSFIGNNLQDNDELLIILRLSGSYELIIELVNFENIQYVNVTVDGSDTIEEVKTKLSNNIENNFNLQNKILTLSCDNIILLDNEMLRNYKINESSIIKCSY